MTCAEQAMTPAAVDAPQDAATAASPLRRFLRRFDRLDARGCAEVFDPDGRVCFADGRVAQGRPAVHECLRRSFADLRSTAHTVSGHWPVGRVWIGEVEATYVLADDSRLGPVSKVFVARTRDGAIEELRVYAAGEPSFHDAMTRHERERVRGDMVRGRWIPPL